MARPIASANDAAAAWKTGFGGSQLKWLAGVNSVTDAPGALAAAASDRYLQGVQNNVPKFVANVGKKTKAEWQADCQAAQGNLTAGAAKGQRNYQQRIGPVLQAIGQIRDSLPARADIMTNLQRSQQMALALHERAQQGF